MTNTSRAATRTRRNLNSRKATRKKGQKPLSGAPNLRAGRYLRRYPVGAELVEGGGVHFRVWAPNSSAVGVELSGLTGSGPGQFKLVALESEAGGYFSGFIAEGRAGLAYKYRLDQGSFPDPTTRFQPQGVHGPSLVVDPLQFDWTDQRWRGVTREKQVIYEMHIGTFAPGGNWQAAMQQLPELARLGITMLEIMPVAEFPGRFGWGYDGVDLFAPTRLYGSPDEMRQFVDRAHQLKMGVILDVVYNHLGPDGNHLKEFSPNYFTDRYANEWGEAINFDGPGSGPVREFFIANARYWIDEYHLDGLRLDATQQIFDSSNRHIVAELATAARAAAQGRQIYMVAENEPQDSRLVRPAAAGGFGLDALWNDDFHHCALVAATGRDEAYYSNYRGSPQEFVSMAKYGFLYQGQIYSWQKKRRGSPALGLPRCAFVNFTQNHDQVANSLHAKRIHQLTTPGKCRALAALLLLGAGTPMLFQGQEFASSSPFYYFADHQPDLANLVAAGRRKFLEQFPSIARPECGKYLAAPAAPETFERSKLDLSEREKHAPIYKLYQDLLRLRRDDSVICDLQRIDGAVLGQEAFVLRYFGGHEDRLLLVNLGRDISCSASEPLLAPSEGRIWDVAWSSEHPAYGGGGTPAVETVRGWRLPGHAAMWMAPVEGGQGKDGKTDS